MKSGRKYIFKINDTFNLNLIISQAYFFFNAITSRKKEKKPNTTERERKANMQQSCCCRILWTPSNTRIYHKLQRIRLTARLEQQQRDDRKDGREEGMRERGKEGERRMGAAISGTFVSHNFVVFLF